MSSDDKNLNAFNPGAFVAIGFMFLMIGMAQDGVLQVVMPLVGVLFMLVSLIGSMRILRDRKQQADAREEPPTDVTPR